MRQADDIVITFSTPHSKLYTTHGHTHTHPPTPLAHVNVHMASAQLNIGHRCRGRFLLLPHGGGEPLPSPPGRIGFPSLKGRRRRKRSWQQHNEHRTIHISNEAWLEHDRAMQDVSCDMHIATISEHRPTSIEHRAPTGVPSLPCRGRGREGPLLSSEGA